MLLQFNVTNVLSFRDEAILDLVANKDTSHGENLISFNKNKVLPTVAIYGANAAGKSNLFKALNSAIQFIRNSNRMQINEKISILPFLLDKNSRNEKRRFDFVFVHEGTKYEYGFTADEDKVYEEYLYEYTSAKASMIFERYEVDKYNYTTTLTKNLKQYEEKNTDNKLFLATATAWNCRETKNAFLWFAEGIDTYSHDSIEATMIEALDSSEKDDIKTFSIDFLKKADFNIADYEFSVKNSSNTKMHLPLGVTLSDNIMPDAIKEWKLDMIHVIDEKGEMTPYPLPYHNESNGTKTFFAYSPLIYQALKNGKTVVVDEIDNGLHPMLVKYVVEIFNDSSINKNGAQLIFNTHDTTLLELDMLRRDQIYFVEKNNNTGTSELYSLSEFSARKTEKVQKGYMQGRYGAVPNIGVGEIKW